MEGRGEKLLCQCVTLGTPLQGVRQQSRLRSSLILTSKGESSKAKAEEGTAGISPQQLWHLEA